MSSDHTTINSFLWFVTMKGHPDELKMHTELIGDLEMLYREAGIFPRARFLGIHFMINYMDVAPEKIKLGRIRKSLNNRLWVDLLVDGQKWEKLTTPQLKDHLMLMMARAVILAGNRYKLRVGPFERKVSELREKLQV